MQYSLLALFVFSSAEAAIYTEPTKDSVELQTGSKISPVLEPKSDKKFFDKDYPADKRPGVNKYYYFSHPYPAVQDSGDYDKDYIKDENSDGGQWQAQMDYDKMRHQIGEAKKKLDELKKKMEEEYKEWMDAKDKAGMAGADLEKANADVAKAKEEADAAEKKVNQLEGSASSDGTKVGCEVGDGVKKVEHEMSELDKCKEELAKAKEKLKRLLKEKEELEAKQKKDQEAAEVERRVRAEKAKEAHEQAKKEVDDAERSAAKAVDDSTFDEAAWRKNLEQAKAKYAEAKDDYEKDQLDVKKTEDQLARAAENLRKYRRDPYVDADGGVYPVKHGKSSAIRAGGVLTFFIAVVAACLA